MLARVSPKAIAQEGRTTLTEVPQDSRNLRLENFSSP